MRASRSGMHFILALLLLSNFAAAQESDRAVAERVLGPQWEQLSRRAGMIFAGTALRPGTQTIPGAAANIRRIDQAGTLATKPGTPAAVQLSFRVDDAIAGVQPGQILTIREWSGVSSTQPPVTKGRHFLMLLHPPSRLGLTSPVGGTLGHIALGANDRNLVQLKRAILAVRGE